MPLWFLILACSGGPTVSPPLDCEAPPIVRVPGAETACNDHKDNDADGLVDCRDPDCPCTEVCANGIDDDRDGLMDCEDAQCAAGCSERCANGIDDDNNGWVDCGDPACLGVGACPSEWVAWVERGREREETLGLSHGWESSEQIERRSRTDLSGHVATPRNGEWTHCPWSVRRCAGPPLPRGRSPGGFTLSSSTWRSLVHVGARRASDTAPSRGLRSTGAPRRDEMATASRPAVGSQGRASCQPPPGPHRDGWAAPKADGLAAHAAPSPTLSWGSTGGGRLPRCTPARSSDGARTANQGWKPKTATVMATPIPRLRGPLAQGWLPPSGTATTPILPSTPTPSTGRARPTTTATAIPTR